MNVYFKLHRGSVDFTINNIVSIHIAATWIYCSLSFTIVRLQIIIFLSCARFLLLVQTASVIVSFTMLCRMCSSPSYRINEYKYTHRVPILLKWLNNCFIFILFYFFWFFIILFHCEKAFWITGKHRKNPRICRTVG